MPPLPPWPLLVLWTAFAFQAWASAGLARRYLRLFRRTDRHERPRYKPHACVIVPFKGVDADLTAGVRSLCEQDYPDYELLLVVDSEADPSYQVLVEELKRYPDRKARVLVAGAAGPNEGQKVHNQLFALGLIYESSADTDAWVFADSDAIPGPQWLGGLIGPLAQEKKTGLTTGYRWLIPQEPAGVWSHMASLMNGSVAVLMGQDGWNHAWGGSMAIRADTARRGDLRGKLTGALCDDYQFTRLSHSLGLRVYFVPACLVASPVSFDRKSFANFVHRQYLLTRVYSPGLFLAALGVTSLYVAGLASVLVYLVIGIMKGESAWQWWAWPVGVLVFATLCNQWRAGYRREAIQKALGDATLEQLKPTLRLDRWATPVWMVLHWLMIVRSAFGGTMRWREIKYRLYAPQRCERI